MSRLKIVVASANREKASELASIFGPLVPEAELVPRPASVPPVEELGATLEENARIKARALREATGLAALADDTGLEVEALGGAPGVRSARYAGADATDAENVAKLLAHLRGVRDRRARFRTVVVLELPGGAQLVADGVAPGTIAAEPRGTGGFGYDAVFIPDDGDGRTFAEMRGDEKQAVSHRGRALRALALQVAAMAGDQDEVLAGREGRGPR
ncbi:MAG TPA: RdgB/HAM1 family non-canonical purine NTP pyrophosphatase [Acidimicrobiales bacterium]|jgi:XTP/dITP diphosphohydrolase|nr:RdgB/HAM1 family non-canonical purine NTP pyrophosphatase [Acidimicrobiales bacterium]